MASEQTEQAQPPASLASTDLATSHRGEQEEGKAARWPDTSLWPSRCAGARRGMQRDAEGRRHRQEQAGAYRKQRQHEHPQGRRGTPLAQSNDVTRGAATGQSLLLVCGGSCREGREDLLHRGDAHMQC